MNKKFISEFSTPTKPIFVGIVDESDGDWDLLRPLFEIYGLGFADTQIGCLFIDGSKGLNGDELKWIEAHEVAHILLGHQMGDRVDEDELEADRFAKRLLLDRGYTEAASLVDEHLLERHQIV